MRKNTCTMILAITLLFACFHNAQASGFIDDPNAVENALKSVLVLEAYVNGELFSTRVGFIGFDSRTIVTNYHIIENAEYIVAYSDEGNVHILTDTKIVDKNKDIAILSSFSTDGLMPLPVNESNSLMRAQKIMKIGNPIGTKNTIAIGTITGLYTENQTDMIQYYMPTDNDPDNGVLFDDSGNVIGICNKSLNKNGAVTIEEVQNLFNTWDGTILSIARIGGAITNKPTPSPSPTVKPTLKPTVKPTAEPTAIISPIGKSGQNNGQQSSSVFLITGVVMQNDETVKITWRGGKGPYTIHYQIAQNEMQSDVNLNYCYWHEKEQYTGNSAELVGIIPGYLYRINMEDANGKTAVRFFKSQVSHFTAYDFRVTITLRQKAYGIAKTINGYNASDIKNGIANGSAYGMTLKFSLNGNNLSRDFNTHMKLVIELPDKDIVPLGVDDTTIYSGSGDSYTYYDFIDLKGVWEDILDSKDGKIPTGTYIMRIYFDNRLLDSPSFRVY